MDVGELVAPDLVNTMPEATAVADHGVICNYTIRVNYTDAQRVLDDLAAVGIDCQAVVTLLEEEGAGKFKPSWALVADQLPDRPWAAQATPPSHTSFHTLTVDQEATTP